MTAHAAGFDLPAAVTGPVVMRPGDIAVVPCGFSMAVPPGTRPRCGRAAGCRAGTASPWSTRRARSTADYRGEVMVPLINLGRAPFTVERGMRIAQMLVLPVPPVEIVEADDLDETDRGAGGFGHTGS